MTKRLVSLVLCFLMLLALPLAGVQASGSKVVIRYWAHQNEAWNKSHLDLAERFNASQDRIEVKMDFFPYDDFESKTQTSLIAKDGSADIYELWGGWAADYAPTGALAVVADDISKTVLENYFKPTYGTFEYEGKLYGVPFEFNIESGGLLVNKALFDEKGLTYPTTWDEMIKLAEENSVGDEVMMEMKGLDFATWDNVMYTWLSMILSSGGNYLDSEGKLDFTNDIAQKAMEDLVSYVKDKHITNVDPLTGGGDNEGHYNLAEGRGLMVIRGPWVIPEIVEIYGLEFGKDIDYIPLPWYGDKAAFAAETGWGLAVASASKNQEAAWEFIRFMMQEDNLVGHLIACGMLPANDDLVDNEKYAEAMPHVMFLTKILADGQYLGHFNTDVFKGAINDMFVALCTTNDYASVADALQALETKLNAELF